MGGYKIFSIIGCILFSKNNQQKLSFFTTNNLVKITQQTKQQTAQKITQQTEQKTKQNKTK